MTYSFHVKADTKEHAIDMVRERMRKVSQQQPAHNKDELHVVATAKTFIGMLADDSERDVQVSMNGSISTTENGVSNIAVSVSAHLVQRRAQ